MRERIALGVGLLAALTLVGLSFAFSAARNPTPVAATLPEAAAPAAPEGAQLEESPPTDPAPTGQVTAQDSVRGRAVLVASGCLRCHSVAGEGNARNPLDGVGARRTQASLRDWATGAEVLADSLAPSAMRAKEPYRRMEPEELAALLAYLGTLRTPPGGAP